jgi:threonine synthase
VHQQFGYVLDPHTAVGYYAAKERVHNNELNPAGNTVVVGTAHPAKFPEAVVEATGVQPTHPTLQALDGLPMRRQSLPCDIEAVKAYLAESLAAE